MPLEGAVRLITRNLEFIDVDQSTGGRLLTRRWNYAAERLEQREKLGTPRIGAARSATVPLFPKQPKLPTADEIVRNANPPLTAPQIESARRARIANTILAIYLDCEEKYRGDYRGYLKSYFAEALKLLKTDGPPGESLGTLEGHARLDRALRLIRNGRITVADVEAFEPMAEELLGKSCPDGSGTFTFTVFNF